MAYYLYLSLAGVVRVVFEDLDRYQLPAVLTETLHNLPECVIYSVQHPPTNKLTGQY